MSAHHSAPRIAVQSEQSGSTRELRICGMSGYGDDEIMLMSSRSALPGYALIESEEWERRAPVHYSAHHLTGTQLRAIAAFFEAAARETDQQGE